jgi:hypothetical protein
MLLENWVTKLRNAPSDRQRAGHLSEKEVPDER